MMHPQEILTKEDLEIIRDKSTQSDKNRTLHQDVLDLIYDHKWFQIMVPRKSGGQEWELPQIVQLFESLAWADANVGWIVNLGAGANMFAGYLNQQSAKEIFDDPKTCCAGSGAMTGKAIKTEGGYLVNGYWKYASGAQNATHFTANCLLYDEHNRPILENDIPAFRSFIFPKSKVKVHDTWKTLGLRATSSHDFEIQNVFVPENHSFTLLSPSAFALGSLYKFPFATLARLNMSVMNSGIALRFLELFEEMSANKKPLYLETALAENELINKVFEKQKEEFNAARIILYEHLEEAWTILKRGILDKNLMRKVEIAAHTLARKSYVLVMELYPFCGMSIVFEGSSLNRVFRDLMTANQHYLVSPLNKPKEIQE